MPKIISVKDAAKMIKPHDRLMCGTFLVAGVAQNLIDALVEENTKDIHLIAISTDFDTSGVGVLVANKQIKSAQISHIGTNKASQAQNKSGETDFELIPQGTLLERIRCAGAGLGGILSPTGIGTIVEEGKKIISVKGKDYMLEEPIEADFGFIRAKKADKYGNLVYDKVARNANPVMAMTAKTVIVEVDEIVEIGEIKSEDVVTPGIFVDYLVKHEEK
ncbi:MAG: CoA transferase subunit A [Candidatus Cloacimonadota bacterium]|nr:CoA transferase subunit A [Candidatus Cloacimonadota bacterium]